MSNKTVTDWDLNRGVGYHDAVYQNDILTLAGADTILKGTILARDSVSEKLVLYVKGGATNENGIPKAILPQQLVVTGAGDSVVRPLVEGRAALTRLVIDADQDNSNIDQPVRDQLRSFGIMVEDNVELTDNEA